MRGKCVLVTGAGGSIGSALAHAVASAGPAALVLLDASEFALYEVDRRLKFPHTAILGNTRDRALLDELFHLQRPDIVLHAAAFKHVPMLEQNPFAAIENNVAGTRTLLEAAITHSAQDFILISTDKAADPLSMMGASKRMAELLLMAHTSSPTRMSAVRLGNVWASQGSVVELFREQIALGGPLTVTHPAASRYFLSVEAAVAAILAALAPRSGGTVLVPELGSPVPIVQVARDLIEAHRSAASIVFSRLRPGEKLAESPIGSRESFSPEPAGPARLLRAIESPAPNPAAILSGIAKVEAAAGTRDLETLLEAIHEVVPEYTPSAILLECVKAAASVSAAGHA